MNNQEDLTLRLKDLLEELKAVVELAKHQHHSNQSTECCQHHDCCAKKRGIIITPSNIENIDELLECCNDDIIAFKYNVDWTLAEFMAALKDTLHDVPLKSLELFGWIFHGNMSNFSVVKDHSIDFSDRKNLAQWQHIIDILVFINTYTTTFRVDMFACNLGTNAVFQSIKPVLEYASDTTFAVSDNETGNIPEGDWILEGGNVNLIGTYLKPNTNDILKSKDVQISLFGGSRSLTFGLTLDGLQNVQNDQDLAYWFIDNVKNSDLNFMVTAAEFMFDGKSPAEVFQFFFDVIAFIPGPIGFAAGMVSAGLAVAIYSEKIAKGKATELDHVDFAAGMFGTLMSAVPGGRAAAKIAGRAARAGSRTVIKASGKVLTKVGDLRIMKNALAAGKRAMTQRIQSLSYDPGFAKQLGYKVAYTVKDIYNRDEFIYKIPEYVDMYNQYTALEGLLGTVTGGVGVGTGLEGEDAEIKLSPNRQSVIEILSALCKTTQNKAALGDVRNQDFATLLSMQYGTCTINGAPKYDNEETAAAPSGTFVDNTTISHVGHINTLKINPCTSVYVTLNGNAYAYYSNTSLYDVIEIKTNIPHGAYQVRAMCSADDASRTASVVIPGVGRVDRVGFSNVWNDNFKHTSVNTTNLSTLVIEPGVSVTMLRISPDENPSDQDVLCAWANNTTAPMTITDLKTILNAKGSPWVVWIAAAKYENARRGRYVRLMFNDTAPHIINVSEMIIRQDNPDHYNFPIRGAQYRLSSRFWNLAGPNADDKNYDTMAHTSDSANDQIVPWLQADLNGLRKISSVEIVNRKDACKDRIVGARIAVFDEKRYVTWMSDPIQHPHDQIDIPVLSGIRPNVIEISCPNGSNFINYVKLYNVADQLIGFEGPTYTKTLAEIAGSGLNWDNTSIATLRVNTYLGIGPMLRKIKLVTNRNMFKPHGNASIRLLYQHPTTGAVTKLWEYERIQNRPNNEYIFDLFEFKALQ